METQFWWVTTNPKKRWSWASIFKKTRKEEFFEKRKIEEHFDHAKVGDFIFGYHAVEKQMVALAWVRKGLHTIKEDGQHYKGILLRAIGKGLLAEPVPWKILSKQLPYSEPVRHNVQGTLFRLSLEESKKIMQLIIRAGNRILLPDRIKHINKLLLPNKDVDSKEQRFAEGEQRAGSTIARNPALRAAAKKKWGMNCFCCGFNFEHFYGEIGKNFAIVHHCESFRSVNSKSRMSSVDDVRIVCANCHYVLHLKELAVTVEELRELISKSWTSWSEGGIKRKSKK